jgi:hypothetical protein
MNTSSSIGRADDCLNDGARRILWPELVVRRSLPVNFQLKDSALFSHELEREIPRTDLLEMRDVRVSPDGILFKRGKILIESFAFPFHRDEWRKRKVLKFLAQNHVFRKHSKFEKDAVWIIDNWSHGYFHWLADALPRLFAIRDRISDLVLLLPQRYEEIEFVHASLKPFFPGKIEFMGKDEVSLCRRLFVPTHTAPSGHYNEEIIRGVRALLVDCYGDQGNKPGGRVYLSRRRAAKRTIVNEAEVVDVLLEFGFQIICAEDLSLAEQVQMFSAARHLVSNHGAGLTNALFMSAGSNLLELRHRKDGINNCYFTLASALDLNYFYQSCEPVNPADNPHTADLHVDATELRTTLKLMLEQ